MATVITSRLSINNNCSLLIENTTGYGSSAFLKPGIDPIPVTSKDYFINDVYHFNYIVYNKYDGTKENVTIDFTGKLVLWDTEDQSATFDFVMNKYMINKSTQLSKDGWFSVYQIGIPKESIISDPRAIAVENYYVKADGLVYTMVGMTETEVNLYNLITTEDLSTSNIIITKTDYVSKCYLTGCFNSILEQFALYFNDPLCVKDNNILNGIRQNRDLLFAVLNTINYYVDLAYYYKASKLIYDVSFCNICRDYIISNPQLNCNCNG